MFFLILYRVLKITIVKIDLKAPLSLPSFRDVYAVLGGGGLAASKRVMLMVLFNKLINYQGIWIKMILAFC